LPRKLLRSFCLFVSRFLRGAGRPHQIQNNSDSGTCRQPAVAHRCQGPACGKSLFHETIKPLLDQNNVDFVGEVNDRQKQPFGRKGRRRPLQCHPAQNLPGNWESNSFNLPAGHLQDRPTRDGRAHAQRRRSARFERGAPSTSSALDKAGLLTFGVDGLALELVANTSSSN